jgi:hypothetical protein
MLGLLLTALLGYGIVVVLLSPIFWSIVAVAVLWESAALRVTLLTLIVVIAVLCTR